MSTHHIDDTLDLAPIRARLRVTNATVENHIDINSCDEQAIMATLSDIHVLIAEVERLQSELAALDGEKKEDIDERN